MDHAWLVRQGRCRLVVILRVIRLVVQHIMAQYVTHVKIITIFQIAAVLIVPLVLVLREELQVFVIIVLKDALTVLLQHVLPVSLIGH